MNVWNGIGRTTAAPDIIQRTDGSSIARFTFAVDRRGDGTDFINCVAFGKTAAFAEKYVRKGAKYGVTGAIRTGSYEGKHGKVYTTEIYVDHIEFCERKADDFTATPEDEKDEYPF